MYAKQSSTGITKRLETIKVFVLEVLNYFTSWLVYLFSISFFLSYVKLYFYVITAVIIGFRDSVFKKNAYLPFTCHWIGLEAVGDVFVACLAG